MGEEALKWADAGDGALLDLCDCPVLLRPPLLVLLLLLCLSPPWAAGAAALLQLQVLRPPSFLCPFPLPL